MKIVMNLFEISVNFFQGVIATYFIYSFLGDKKQRNYIKSHGMLFALIFTSFVLLFNHFVFFEHFLSGFYVLVLFIYALTCLKGSVAQKLFISVYSIMLMFVSTIGVSSIGTLIYNGNISSILESTGAKRVVSVIAAQLLIVYLMKFSIKLFRKEENLTKNEWLFISIMLLFSAIIGILMVLAAIQSENMLSQTYLALGLIAIVIINIILIYFIVGISHKNKELMERETDKTRLEYYSQYIKNAETDYQLIRKIRHDTKNLHNVVIELLTQNKVEQAIEYLTDINEKLFERKIYLNTSNDVVNAVVNAKLSIASSLDIEVTCMSIYDFGDIDDVDLCRLLSNMLENAITAFEKQHIENKSIIVNISENDSSLFFVVRNSISDSVMASNPKLHTTKSDKLNHGIGIEIIKDIAEKYHGKCDFYERNNMFHCVVILSKNEGAL